MMSPWRAARRDDTMFRWFALVVFLATLAVSAGRRWHARRAGGAIRRSEEPPGLIVGRLLVALPLFGGVAGYLVNPAWMDWASFPLPAWALWIGAALGLLVVPAANWVLTSLGTNVSETVLTKPEHRLVTTGPYRWVRHPLYTVGIALFLSIGLMAANWFILLWALAALSGIRLVVIPREEAQLVARFGDDYRRYRNRTGALLPSPLAVSAHSRASPLEPR
jgi:protein-S-isoprenylcysteine O-methyltransferase Ste14